jgi:hypothetical protein
MRTRWIALGLACALSLVQARPAQASNVADAALEFGSALPGKYSGMAAGWFFFNVYMTEWYSGRVDRLTLSSSSTLFRLAADKETNDTLAQFDQKIAKEKDQSSKQEKAISERNAYMDKNFDKVDTNKKLSGDEKKDLAVALLQTGTAILMAERASRSAKNLVSSSDRALAEVTAGANPMQKAKAAGGVNNARKSLPRTTKHLADGLPRLKKISESLNALARTNDVKPPSEQEMSEAEKSYTTEVTFE